MVNLLIEPYGGSLLTKQSKTSPLNIQIQIKIQNAVESIK